MQTRSPELLKLEKIQKSHNYTSVLQPKEESAQPRRKDTHGTEGDSSLPPRKDQNGIEIAEIKQETEA